MLTLEGRLLMISPHLDDAVFACGRLIASHPSCVVLTVFAGRPSSTNPLTQWDRASGFEPGDDVIGARREEDRAALYLLRAAPVWLDFLDSQYGRTPQVEEVARELETMIGYVKPRSVLFPLGLFHSDHLLTHRAARTLAVRHTEVQWVAYEDALYRRIPGALEGRLAELEGERLHPRKVAWPDAPRAELRKRAALDCYRSQLRALATPGRLGHRDAYEGEGYWVLEGATGEMIEVEREGSGLVKDEE